MLLPPMVENGRDEAPLFNMIGLTILFGVAFTHLWLRRWPSVAACMWAIIFYLFCWSLVWGDHTLAQQLSWNNGMTIIGSCFIFRGYTI